MKSIAIMASIVVLFVFSPLPLRAGEPTSPADLPAWLGKTQTYCMVPVLPETAAKLHVTVNGVWAGISGTHPILTSKDIVPAVTAKYGDNPKAFVDACHQSGLVVFSVVNGLEGFTSLRSAGVDLDKMACRDAQGKPIQAGKDMILMCTNNPDWLKWEIDHGKRGIDLGADAVFVDTPMSSAFVSGFLRGGFCPHCLANFEKYLNNNFTRAQLAERFDLAEFDAKAVAARLSPLQNLSDPKNRPHHNSSKDDLLFREFIYCQEQASFDTRKRLVEALRAHARSKARKIALVTNAADLGSVNPGGHWVRALMFADLFDLFAYEQNLEPAGMTSNEVTRYPRGKWAAYHRLAHAVHGRRAPAVIHAGAMGRVLIDVLTKRKTTNTWMEVQSAEAYAANGAYIQYYIEPNGMKLFLDKCWSGATRHAGFVQSHLDFYDGELRSGSPLAILFLMNERGRTIPAVFPSYLGFAQALTEANFPFDVVFAGDGHYVRDRLTNENLRPYQTILVPSPIAPTPNQQRLIQKFVEAGGTLVCQEPEKLGLTRRDETAPPASSCLATSFRHGKGEVLVLRGKITDTWTDDAGANFFKTYEPGLRTEIARLAESLHLARILPEEATGKISAFPVLQLDKKRLLLHLVNYDIDYDKDAIRERSNLTVRVRRPGFLPERIVARWHTPGKATQKLEVSTAADGWALTVPRFGISGVVAISEQ